MIKALEAFDNAIVMADILGSSLESLFSWVGDLEGKFSVRISVLVKDTTQCLQWRLKASDLLISSWALYHLHLRSHCEPSLDGLTLNAQASRLWNISCSTQLSMTIVGILAFISRINTASECFREWNIYQHLSFYEELKLSLAWKSFTTSRPTICLYRISVISLYYE